MRQTPIKVSMLVFRDEEQYKEEDLYDTFTVVLNKPSNKGLGLSIVGKRNDVGVFVSDVVSARMVVGCFLASLIVVQSS